MKILGHWSIRIWRLWSERRRYRADDGRCHSYSGSEDLNLTHGRHGVADSNLLCSCVSPVWHEPLLEQGFFLLPNVRRTQVDYEGCWKFNLDTRIDTEQNPALVFLEAMTMCIFKIPIYRLFFALQQAVF